MWNYESFLYHYGVKGMRKGIRRSRQRVGTGQAAPIYTIGTGLQTGPVGKADAYANRPTSSSGSTRIAGRKRTVGGTAKSVKTSGSGLGTGAVGKKDKYKQKTSKALSKSGSKKATSKNVSKGKAKLAKGMTK